jgi:hypothetical protein
MNIDKQKLFDSLYDKTELEIMQILMRVLNDPQDWCGGKDSVILAWCPKKIDDFNAFHIWINNGFFNLIITDGGNITESVIYLNIFNRFKLWCIIQEMIRTNKHLQGHNQNKIKKPHLF